MSTEPPIDVAIEDVPSVPPAASESTGAPPAQPSGTERPAKTSTPSSVASTANQILFKNELYTTMKQKTMDQELMVTINREAQEREKRRFENARVAVDKVAHKRKVLVGVGDMLGPPGSDPSPYSSASISVDLSSGDTVRDVKKKVIALCEWTDERPEDFGLFDDTSEEAFKDALPIESALSVGTPAPAGRSAGAGNHRRAGGWGRLVPMRLPSPYVGLLWAARTG